MSFGQKIDDPEELLKDGKYDVVICAGGRQALSPEWRAKRGLTTRLGDTQTVWMTHTDLKQHSSGGCSDGGGGALPVPFQVSRMHMHMHMHSTLQCYMHIYNACLQNVS